MHPWLLSRVNGSHLLASTPVGILGALLFPEPLQVLAGKLSQASPKKYIKNITRVDARRDTPRLDDFKGIDVIDWAPC